MKPAFMCAGDDPAIHGVCFKGGGTSSTSSSSTAATDSRVGASDQAVAVGAGGTLSINLSNPEGFTQLLDLGKGFFEGALEFAASQSEAAGNAYTKAIDVVAASKNTESQNLGLQVLKQAAPVLLVVGLGFFMSRAK